LVARWAHNPKVDGSSPSPATKSKQLRRWESFLIHRLISSLRSP